MASGKLFPDYVAFEFWGFFAAKLAGEEGPLFVRSLIRSAAPQRSLAMGVIVVVRK